MLCPSVLMIRQPPAAVPAAMVSAQATLTQVATSNSGVSQEAQPPRQVVERAAGRGGEQGQGDDAHRLLRVVGAVAEAHQRGADQLQAAEDHVHAVRPPVAQHDAAADP